MATDKELAYRLLDELYEVIIESMHVCYRVEDIKKRMAEVLVNWGKINLD